MPGALLSLLALSLARKKGKSNTLETALLVRFYYKSRTSIGKKAQIEMSVTGCYTTLLYGFVLQSRTFERLGGSMTLIRVFRRSKPKRKVV
jgi:hypothetical protein